MLVQGSANENRQGYYREFSTLKWDVDHKGTFVEARIETAKGLLKDFPDDLPVSRIRISNLSDGKTIYAQELNERPFSMYTRDVNGDQREELILIWTAGAVANQMQILSVDAAQAHVLLEEGYRVDAALIDLNKGVLDVMITDGESGDGPFYTTRYVWKGKRYEAVGKVPYERFVDSIKRQFNKARQPSSITH